MDWSLLAAQWLRALRGRRSQRAASKRLGYSSNILYRWEAGYCAPLASTAFSAAARFSVNVDDAVLGFLGVPAHDRDGAPAFTTREGIRYLLERVRGEASFIDLAKRTSFNRFALSRWYRGAAEPKLPELLQLIEATTHRVLDFIAAFCDPAHVPCVAEKWRAHRALRDAAFDAPWSHAVLRVLELGEYHTLRKHEAGWIAARLGISVSEEERCIRLLEQSQQIQKRSGRWVVTKQGTIDTGQDPARARELRRFWLEEALRRFNHGARGAFGYNLFTISDKDYESLRALYVQYFEAMRTLIADSTPGDKLVLFCGQLVEMDGTRREAPQHEPR
jgi:hypothetical protein